MIHTIKEINQRKDILPNITLGYQIFDSCSTISKTMESAMVFLTGQEENKPNIRNSTGAYLAGIVGSGGSSLSIAASRILGLYFLPQVGYASSCSILSDKFQFPTYVRTVASDKFQSMAMVKLIQHFGWVWVGTIAGDDDYGKYGVKIFKEHMENANLCVAFSETIPKVYSNEKMQRAMQAVKNSTARVVVLYASDLDLHPFMLEMVHHNITHRTWIATEAWITSALLAKPEYFPYFGGSIGFAIPRSDIPGLKEFLYDIHPSRDPDDVLTIEFWQTAFNCTWPNSSVPYNVDHRVNMTGKEDRLHSMSDKLCTGQEKLEDLKNTYLDVSQLRITNNVKQAVYTLAHALDHLSRCEEGQGPFIPGNTCAYIPDFDPWQLMFYVKTVQFTTHDGKTIQIDKNGDVMGHYDILNWQLDDNGEIAFMKVGEYIFTENKFELVFTKNSTIFWNTESSQCLLLGDLAVPQFGSCESWVSMDHCSKMTLTLQGKYQFLNMAGGVSVSHVGTTSGYRRDPRRVSTPVTGRDVRWRQETRHPVDLTLGTSLLMTRLHVFSVTHEFLHLKERMLLRDPEWERQERQKPRDHRNRQYHHIHHVSACGDQVRLPALDSEECVRRDRWCRDSSKTLHYFRETLKTRSVNPSYRRTGTTRKNVGNTEQSTIDTEQPNVQTRVHEVIRRLRSLLVPTPASSLSGVTSILVGRLESKSLVTRLVVVSQVTRPGDPDFEAHGESCWYHCNGKPTGDVVDGLSRPITTPKPETTT
ncbi:Hypothetical predicted protein [Marmota monax]|uniref:Receptor ligand binding region domain-containing protein n=1 Tax=Marmota monax TaxID=9995 RepID=A0A5E4BSW1_MARMO|nr:Hypothetical predicted protein [Marmota monax]